MIEESNGLTVVSQWSYVALLTQIRPECADETAFFLLTGRNIGTRQSAGIYLAAF